MVVALAAAVQVTLYLHGLYSVSDDESEKALLSYHLGLATVLKPFLWPPLPMVVTGLALKIHRNLITTPRLVSGITSLLALGATVLLARKLFDRRTVAVVAGVLAAFLPQRLILGVAPLADTYSYLLVVLAAAFLLDWLRTDRPRALMFASVALLLASSARFEDWLFNVVLAVYVGYRAVVRRDVGWTLAGASIALLAAFPLFWVGAIYVHDGSLAALSTTSKQFIAEHGHDVALALHVDVLYLFVHDCVYMPVLLAGVIALLIVVRRDRVRRTWAILVFGPLLLLGASMAVTLSAPLAAPFRVDGTWVLLLIPFAAWGVVQACRWVIRTRSPLVAAVAVAAVVLLSLIPMAAQARAEERTGVDQSGALADTSLKTQLRLVLRSTNRSILLDSFDGLDYLNVLAVSNDPNRFVLDVDSDPTRASLYSSARPYYVSHHDMPIVDKYLTDRFGLHSTLNRRALAQANVGYILVHNANLARRLATEPGVGREQRLGAWTLFGLAT
jgi:hypothetical protein